MDSIANFLTILRNAQMAGKKTASVPLSKMNLALLEILKSNQYVSGFTTEDKTLAITFNPVRKLNHYKRVSKPGRRIYTEAKHVPSVLGGTGIVIISSPEGVITGQEARKRKVGGEILCEIY